ncbi:MAG: hypothetical protein O2782_18115 [bacterium]|nr:hypothetical protein [bacterium]
MIELLRPFALRVVVHDPFLADTEAQALGVEKVSLEEFNVHLSTHIAGSMGDEVVRMADYVLDEFQRWEKGERLHWEVTAELLQRMA